MASAGELDYYRSQSWVTEPGAAVVRFGGPPDDIAGIKVAAHFLVTHYRADRPLEHGVAPERMSEIDTRYAAAMFERLADLDGAPFGTARETAGRLVGCCRDFTVLFVSLARAAGIPARARVGFASYFIPGYYVDHVVGEVWDESSSRWRLVDAELEDGHRGAVRAEDGGFADALVDPLDVPRSGFLVGGEAWRLCRAGEAEAADFLVAPDVDVEMTRGWPYLAHNVVHDLAALNKQEMLLWDSWGVLERFGPSGPEDRLADLLDKVAAITGPSDSQLQEVQDVYERHPELQVPATVTSYDPMGGPPREVLLGREATH